MYLVCIYPLVSICRRSEGFCSKKNANIIWKLIANSQFARGKSSIDNLGFLESVASCDLVRDLAQIEVSW